jgi:DNA-binding NtrC family response regulator
VIAATNGDLPLAVEEGKFRLDLYYRINVFTIELPPLRERGDDIPLLAEHFLERSAREMGKPASGFSRDALQCLKAYDWPGNVRELENAVERAIVVQKGREIQLEDLPVTDPPRTHQAPTQEAQDLSLAELEKQHIQEVLDQMAGNVSKAARALKIDRVTLYNKIKKYGLRRQG